MNMAAENDGLLELLRAPLFLFFPRCFPASLTRFLILPGMLPWSRASIYWLIFYFFSPMSRLLQRLWREIWSAEGPHGQGKSRFFKPSPNCVYLSCESMSTMILYARACVVRVQERSMMWWNPLLLIRRPNQLKQVRATVSVALHWSYKSHVADTVSRWSF